MIGYRAAVNRMRIDDFHATVLDILGMDHKRLAYRFSDRNFRLIDVAEPVHHRILL